MQATASVPTLGIRNILVATDFSTCSRRALLHAVAAAHHFGSTLHLVHVVDPRLFSLAPPEGYIDCVGAAQRVQELARADAESTVSEVLHRAHCEELTRRIWVQSGVPGETVRALIEREHFDLAVVGTHGRTGLRRIVLGSVAEDIFRHASCPVLTVGPHSWGSQPQSVRLRHILFPTDGSADSARALPFALALAADFEASLTLLTVGEALDDEASPQRRRVVAALQERMRDMVGAVAPMPPQTDFQVEFGDAAEQVLESAARLGTDLIVCGLRSPDTYSDHLPWMQAYKVVCQAGCPVLTLRGLKRRDP